MSGKWHVADVRVVDIQKKRVPNKHYVYGVLVTWSNGDQFCIYRKYCMFFEFQAKLYEMFPETQDGKLPSLPGRMHALAHVHNRAAKKAKKISSFCQALIKLPPAISQCDDVLGFFEAWDQDRELKIDRNAMQVNPLYDFADTARSSTSEHNYQEIEIEEDCDDDVHEMEAYRAIAPYFGLGRNEVSFEAGQIVHVIDKNDNGWWLIQTGEKEGRAPGSHLEPVSQLTGEPEEQKPVEYAFDESYVAVADYAPQDGDEVQLMEGTAVEVIEKNMDGWWRIRLKDRVGFAPSTYLRKLSKKGQPQSRECAGYMVESSSDVYTLPLKPPPRPSWRERRRISSGSSYAMQEVRRDVDIDSAGYVTVSKLKQNRSSSESDTSLGTRIRTPRSQSLDQYTGQMADTDYQNCNSLVQRSGSLDKNAYTAIRSYRCDEPHGIYLMSGDEVHVDREDGGWAFVFHLRTTTGASEGWVPMSYLKKADDESGVVNSTTSPMVVLSCDEPSELVVAIENYTPKDPSTSLGFSEGQHATVLEKSGGWWFVRIGRDEGWVPGGFFEPVVMSPSTATGGDAPHLPPRRSPQSSPLVARKRFTDPDVIPETTDDLAQEGNVSQDRGEGRRPGFQPQAVQNTYLKPRIAAASSQSPDIRRRSKSPTNMEDLGSQVWYHGQMSRADAEMLLLNHGNERDFLIRESSNRVGNFAISVKHGNKVRHFPVENQGGKLLIGQHYYDKMTEIVRYYMSYPLFFLEEEGVSLGAPVKKP